MLKLEKRHDFVYYVAPLFHLPSELANHYISKNVVNESRFIKPSTIKKMPDDKEHFVSFRKTGKPYRFSKDPVELEEFDSADILLEKIKQASQRKISLEDALEKAVRSMIDALKEENKDPKGRRHININTINRLDNLDMPLAEKATFIANTYFDCQLLSFSRKDAV
jgi:hypothetical protein